MSCQRVGCFAAHSSIASISSSTRRSFWVSFFRMNDWDRGDELSLFLRFQRAENAGKLLYYIRLMVDGTGIEAVTPAV